MAGDSRSAFWLADPADDHKPLPRPSRADVQRMAASVAQYLEYLSAEVHNFNHQWLAARYNHAAVADIEFLYKNLYHDWLPAGDPSDKDLQVTSIAEPYKKTETELQMFAVAIEQAARDDKSGGEPTFHTLEQGIKQVLDLLRQHMRAMRIQRNPAVGRDIMPDEQRIVERPDTRIISREFLTLRQLSSYAANRAKIFSKLTEHPELATSPGKG